MNPGRVTLQDLRELLTAQNEARYPEVAVFELRLGDAVGAFRDTEVETLKRFHRDGYPAGFAAARETGIFSGDFDVLMGLTLSEFWGALLFVARLNAAPELEARGRELATVWVAAENRLRELQLLP